MKVKILYDQKDKFIIAYGNKKIGYLIKNEFTRDIQIGSYAQINVEPEIIKVNDREVGKFEIKNPTDIEYTKDIDYLKVQTSRTPEEEFNEIKEQFIAELASSNKNSKIYKKGIALKFKSKIVENEISKILNDHKQKQNSENKKDKKVLVSLNDKDHYKVGSIFEKSGKLLTVRHIGKDFKFIKNPKSKSKFNTGDDVCYIYCCFYEPKAHEFIEATKEYYDLIKSIKKTGVKPRHSASEVARIKTCKALCDSRLKIDGNSWFAFDHEFIWYINHKLSPITIDNNIKINNQMAQCWRIPIWQIKGILDKIKKIDMVLFKSNAIPNAVENMDEIEEI